MNEVSSTAAWHDATEAFLHDLRGAQEELLAELAERRRRRMADHEQPAGVTPVEKALLQRLEQCHQRRSELVRAARQAGLPGQTLRAAAGALHPDARSSLQALLDEAESAGRRLRLACLTHWMLARRSLAHISQLLEILATGTPQPPTYGNGAVSTARGSLLDEAA
jgi:hypothetical protein